MLTSELHIPVGGGSFGASLRLPAGAAAPVVVLAHEIFGINEFMKYTANWLAAAGFAVLCPDLFWRQEAGVSLQPGNERDMQKAMALWKGFDMQLGIADLNATAAFAMQQPWCNGRVSLVGYCLGGSLAVQMASQPRIHKSVGYYGVGLEDMTEQVAAVSTPLMMHMPARDHLVSEDACRKITASMARNEQITLHWYENEGHAFARWGGANYSAAAAALANERTLRFLQN